MTCGWAGQEKTPPSWRDFRGVCIDSQNRRLALSRIAKRADDFNAGRQIWRASAVLFPVGPVDDDKPSAASCGPKQ